jgi:hypothetical protein
MIKILIGRVMEILNKGISNFKGSAVYKKFMDILKFSKLIICPLEIVR